MEKDEVDEIKWIPYTNTISINDIGNYILYVKVTDECDLISYASTPNIVYDGYVVSNLKPINFNEGNSITKKSSIMFDISYSNNSELNIIHILESNVELPLNTKIIMLDKINNKVYDRLNYKKLFK